MIWTIFLIILIVLVVLAAMAAGAYIMMKIIMETAEKMTEQFHNEEENL